MENIDDELIDAYLDEKLSTTQLAEFERRLVLEPELRESLAFASRVKKASQIALESLEIKAKLKLVDWERESVRLWPSVAKWSAVAAVLFMVLFYFQPGRESNQSLFERGIGQLVTMNTGSGTIGDSRGPEIVYSRGLTGRQAEELVLSIDMLNQQDSLNAYRKLLVLHKAHPRNTRILFYLAVCELKIGRTDAAIKHLIVPGDPSTDDRRSYYLALAYIKVGENRKARSLLLKLSKTGSPYATPAAKILRKLRWSLF